MYIGEISAVGNLKSHDHRKKKHRKIYFFYGHADDWLMETTVRYRNKRIAESEVAIAKCSCIAIAISFKNAVAELLFWIWVNRYSIAVYIIAVYFIAGSRLRLRFFNSSDYFAVRDLLLTSNTDTSCMDNL